MTAPLYVEAIAAASDIGEETRRYRVQRDALRQHLTDVMESIGSPEQWAAIRAARKCLDNIE